LQQVHRASHATPPGAFRKKVESLFMPAQAAIQAHAWAHLGTHEQTCTHEHIDLDSTCIDTATCTNMHS
jgi:hypothetical protein